MIVPDYREGDEQSATWLNALMAWVRGARIKAVPPLYCDRTPGGQVLRYHGPQEADFEVTTGTNPYAGKEKRAVAGGLWQDRSGGRTPTVAVDPLYERNRWASVAPGTVVHAVRDRETGAWIFDRTACSGSASPAPAPAPAPSPAPSPAPAPGPSPAPMARTEAPAQPFAPAWPTLGGSGPGGLSGGLAPPGGYGGGGPTTGESPPS